MRLPRGRADLLRQLIIWFGFAAGYQIARGLADRGREPALAHAEWVVRFERRLHLLFEPGLQDALRNLGAVITAVNWTYWLSQFVVVGLGLLWIYLRRYGAYLLVRDTIIVTNTIGLLGYVLFPTAPPRLVPGLGVTDTLVSSGALNHGSGIVELAENPHAAMPSLHFADALIIGAALAVLVRPYWLRLVWAVWPAWVGFALMVTGNHFWADMAVGAALVALTVPATFALERLRGRRERSVVRRKRRSASLRMPFATTGSKIEAEPAQKGGRRVHRDEYPTRKPARAVRAGAATRPRARAHEGDARGRERANAARDRA